MDNEEYILEDKMEVVEIKPSFVNPIDPDDYKDEELIYGLDDELVEDFKGLIRTHKKIIRAKFDGAKSLREIARLANETLGSVQNSMKNPIVRKLITEITIQRKKEIKNEMLEQLSEAGNEAIQTLRGLMKNAESEKIKREAADTILNLIFKTLNNGQKINIKDNNILLTDKLPVRN